MFDDLEAGDALVESLRQFLSELRDQAIAATRARAPPIEIIVTGALSDRM